MSAWLHDFKISFFFENEKQQIIKLSLPYVRGRNAGSISTKGNTFQWKKFLFCFIIFRSTLHAKKKNGCVVAVPRNQPTFCLMKALQKFEQEGCKMLVE